MIEKQKQPEWSERAQGACDLHQMRSLAAEIINSNSTTDEQKSAAKSALNAIETALKKSASENNLVYARNRFASLRMTL